MNIPDPATPSNANLGGLYPTITQFDDPILQALFEKHYRRELLRDAPEVEALAARLEPLENPPAPEGPMKPGKQGHNAGITPGADYHAKPDDRKRANRGFVREAVREATKDLEQKIADAQRDLKADVHEVKQTQENAAEVFMDLLDRVRTLESPNGGNA